MKNIILIIRDLVLRDRIDCVIHNQKMASTSDTPEDTFYQLLIDSHLSDMIKLLSPDKELYVYGSAVRLFLREPKKYARIDTDPYGKDKFMGREGKIIENQLHLYKSINMFTNDPLLIHKLGKITSVMYSDGKWNFTMGKDEISSEKFIFVDLICSNLPIAEVCINVVDVDDVLFDIKGKIFGPMKFNCINDSRYFTLNKMPTMRDLLILWHYEYRPKNKSEFVKLIKDLKPNGYFAHNMGCLVTHWENIKKYMLS